jgi:hypothetical protein
LRERRRRSIDHSKDAINCCHVLRRRRQGHAQVQGFLLPLWPPPLRAPAPAGHLRGSHRPLPVVLRIVPTGRRKCRGSSRGGRG